jgi:uncharacterized protein (DUF1499 family)
MWIVVLVAAVAAGTFTAVAVQVDDWGRDLRTTVARTDSAAEDPLLRPLVTRASLDEVAEAVRGTVAELPRWRLAEQARDDGGLTLRCERTSRLFRFTDDVVVRIEDRGSDRLVSAVSRSRVGRGDLGQNPRNLKQLFRALREFPLLRED